MSRCVARTPAYGRAGWPAVKHGKRNVAVEAGQTAEQEREPSGTGLNIEVHSFPLDGRIVLFPADSEARSDEPADGMPALSPERSPVTGSRGSHANRRTR